LTWLLMVLMQTQKQRTQKQGQTTFFRAPSI
jgi:hypothetical protein